MKTAIQKLMIDTWRIATSGFKPLDQITSVDKGIQLMLALKYREIAAKNLLPLRFDEVEFRSFSQNGEDGILLYIFSLVGTTNKRCVEICAGNGIQCNVANLITNHGWIGLLFDGDRKQVELGKRFYGKCRDTWISPPYFLHEWITVENVNTLIRKAGFEGEIDLLSLDMDGIDYWIWQALTCVSPRVVVLEFNNLWGTSRSVSIPYNPDFRASFGPFGPDYAGASLPAFVKLGKAKGYRLVGCQRYGFNAFFVRTDVQSDSLPEIDPSSCFDHPFSKYAIEHRLPKVAEKIWVEV